MHRLAALAVDAAELEPRAVVAPGQQVVEAEVQARLVQRGLDQQGLLPLLVLVTWLFIP